MPSGCESPIAANLAAKGIQPADRDAADCVVGYAMGSRQVFNDYYAGGWGAAGVTAGAGAADSTVAGDGTVPCER